MEKHPTRQMAHQLAEVLETWLDYRAGSSYPTVAGFAQWVLQRHTATEAPPEFAPAYSTNGESRPEYPASMEDKVGEIEPREYLAVLLSRLAKFAQLHYAQKLEDQIELSLDEFLYLLVVAEKGTPRKTDAIRQLLHEPATGSKTIQRLQQQELLAVHDNPRDGRSQLLALTEKGWEHIRRGLPLLSQMAAHVAGPLSPTEVLQAVQLLDRLNAHHTQLYFHRG
jgi:DNA-binding MarR family transcriptional regulator